MHLIILGGGFSGAALALQLARHANASSITAVSVVDPAPVLGLGQAYSTPFACHLLNVRHMNMSLYDEDRAHFSTWLEQEPQWPLPSEYVERRIYGRYVRDCLAKQSAERPLIQHIRAKAVDIEPPKPGVAARVHLDNGARLEGARVALCLGSGNLCPPSIAHLAKLGAPCAILEPWRWEQFARLPAHGEIFILGTGLTMIDAVLALQERGFSGSITAMSRHGLCPQPHLSHTQPQPQPVLPTPRTVATLTRAVRAAAGSAALWQPVMDSLRADTPALWQALSTAERRRFVRQVKPFWDAHRHRIAPAIHERLQSLLASGKLSLSAGHLLEAQPDGQGFTLQLRKRGSTAPVRQRVDGLVSCTGLDTDWRVPRTAVVQALQRRGLLQADPLGLGVVANAAGELVDAQGHPSPWLSVLGSALIGRDLESTAVPELRQQARRVAAQWMDS